MAKRENQITVPLDPELRAFVERQVAREHCSLAGQIRHLVAEAATKQRSTRGGGSTSTSDASSRHQDYDTKVWTQVSCSFALFISVVIWLAKGW